MRIGSGSNPSTLAAQSAQMRSGMTAAHTNGKQGGTAAANATPIQKRLATLQEQLKKLKEGTAPNEDKTTQIQSLEEEIATLQKQIFEEQQRKASEAVKPKEEKQDEQTKTLQEKGFNIVSDDIVEGVVSSSGSMKLAQTARAQYVAAKARKDTAAMDRALGYQTSLTAEAKKALDDVAKAEAAKAISKQKPVESAHADPSEDVPASGAASTKQDIAVTGEVASSSIVATSATGEQPIAAQPTISASTADDTDIPGQSAFAISEPVIYNIAGRKETSEPSPSAIDEKI